MDFLAREIAGLRMSVGELATRDYLRSELQGGVARDARRGSSRKTWPSSKTTAPTLGACTTRKPTVTPQSPPLKIPESPIRAALHQVNDPEIRRPITDLGMVDGS